MPGRSRSQPECLTGGVAGVEGFVCRSDARCATKGSARAGCPRPPVLPWGRAWSVASPPLVSYTPPLRIGCRELPGPRGTGHPETCGEPGGPDPAEVKGRTAIDFSGSQMGPASNFGHLLNPAQPDLNEQSRASRTEPGIRAGSQRVLPGALQRAS